MRTIELDASNWKTITDFYDSLLPAIGAPAWHSRGIDPCLDTMIWHDDINEAKPPYTVRVLNARNLPNEVGDHIHELHQYLKEDREKFRAERGRDIEVFLDIVP